MSLGLAWEHRSSRDPSASAHLSAQPPEQTHTFPPEVSEPVSCTNPHDLSLSVLILIRFVLKVAILKISVLATPVVTVTTASMD